MATTFSTLRDKVDANRKANMHVLNVPPTGCFAAVTVFNADGEPIAQSVGRKWERIEGTNKNGKPYDIVKASVVGNRFPEPIGVFAAGRTMSAKCEVSFNLKDKGHAQATSSDDAAAIDALFAG